MKAGGYMALTALLALACRGAEQSQPTPSPVVVERPSPKPKTPSVDEAHRTWKGLLSNQLAQEAMAQCRQWLEASPTALRVEAYKCLANAILAQGQQIQITADDTGGGSLGSGPAREDAERAVEYLNRALAIDPNDLSLHQGRLHILMVSGAFDRTAEALLDSVSTYKGSDGLTAWLAYSPRFMEARQYKAAVRFLHVLEDKYPDDHRVIANLGGFYGMLEDDDKALKYAQRGVELAPEDPFNNWNLGRLYDYSNDLEKAEKYYSRSLKLFTDPSEAMESYCLYVEFLNDRRHARSRACLAAKTGCPTLRDKYCGRP